MVTCASIFQYPGFAVSLASVRHFKCQRSAGVHLVGCQQKRRMTIRAEGSFLEGTQVAAKKVAAAAAAAAPAANGLAAVDAELTPLPVLSISEVLARLQRSRHDNTDSYGAMYSSVLGGITKEPAAMVVPLDDHMVHRGHAVFDTVLIHNGYLYELEPHLDRFFRSASSAGIAPHISREEVRHIIVETAAVSGVRDGHVRYWFSAGIGGFHLTTSECVRPSFYAIALANVPPRPSTAAPAPAAEAKAVGVKVVTSSVPIKDPQFATMKSNGAYAGIWLDKEGYVAEGPSMNVAFVTTDRVLLVPDFDNILAGVSVAEARGAAEMMLCGSGTQVKPVVQWDDWPVGDGAPGPVTLALQKLLLEDMESAPEPQRIRIDYR
eukprot:jgi/Mesen1/489/ME001024S10720